MAESTHTTFHETPVGEAKRSDCAVVSDAKAYDVSHLKPSLELLHAAEARLKAEAGAAEVLGERMILATALWAVRSAISSY